jgi:hypothetical protein
MGGRAGQAYRGLLFGRGLEEMDELQEGLRIAEFL